jgi:hypothetical protein
MLKIKRYLSFLLLSLLFLCGAVSPLQAFTVDVSRIYYADSIRTIDYDFATGSKTGNIITIPAGKVLPTDGLTYTFGLVPGTIDLSLSWTAPNSCTLESSSYETQGAAAVQTTGTPAAAQTSWEYMLELRNFTGVVGSGNVSKIMAGLGNDEGAGGDIDNQPQIEVSWLPNGDMQLQAKNGGGGENIGDPKVLSGLTPATTILLLRIQNTGSAINFFYELQETGGFVSFANQSLGAEVIPGFPNLFPFVILDLDVTDPAFNVTSGHKNDNYGNEYYAYVYVDDPGQATYSSITVTMASVCGAGLPSVALTYDGSGRWWLSPSVSLSTNIPPGCFPTFTFTAQAVEQSS